MIFLSQIRDINHMPWLSSSWRYEYSSHRPLVVKYFDHWGAKIDTRAKWVGKKWVYIFWWNTVSVKSLHHEIQGHLHTQLLTWLLTYTSTEGRKWTSQYKKTNLNKYKTLVLNHGVCFKIIWGTCANDSNIKVWILSLKIPSRWF